MNGIVFDIQRFCIHDGPGIRTTVFLKGCTQRCLWCHNPESMSPLPETNAVTGKTIGHVMDVEAVLETVERDRSYYENSGGGITLSGGEPLLQIRFAQTMLHEAKQQGLHTCLDTAGNIPCHFYSEVLADTDLFLFDIKAHDPEKHRRYTGVTNTRILSNLDFLYRHDAAIILRCPLVPGVNDEDDHLRFVGELAQGYPNIKGVEIMPYHNIARDKWRAIGKELPLGDLASANASDHERWLAILRPYYDGVKVN